MGKNVPGITLIELVIGLLLSSLLMTALFSIYGTITKTIARATEKMERDRAVAVFQNQWQKDIEGIFAPPYPEKEKKKKEPDDTQKEKKEKAAAAQEPEIKKEKPKSLKKIFDSINKDKQLDVLTFITSNPVAVYEKAQAGTVKPRMVRVVYRLKSDGKKPASYLLMRQESDILDFEKFKPQGPKAIKQYELIGRIKNLTVEFLVAEQQKEKEKDKEKEKKEKKGKKFKTSKEWHSDERQKEEKEVPLIPQIVRTTLVVYDVEKKREFSYSFDYQIEAYNQKIVIIEKEAPRPPAPAQSAPAASVQLASPSPGPGLPFTLSPRLTSLLDQIEQKLDEKLGMR